MAQKSKKKMALVAFNKSILKLERSIDLLNKRLVESHNTIISILQASKPVEQDAPKILGDQKLSGSINAIDTSVVERYLNDGYKLSAVKYVREVSGLGLRESKNWVDNYQNTKGKV